MLTAEVVDQEHYSLHGAWSTDRTTSGDGRVSLVQH